MSSIINSPNICPIHKKLLVSFCKTSECSHPFLCNLCEENHKCPNQTSLKISKIEPYLLDNYEFLNLLGKGAFGRVFKVRSIWTMQTFALKVMKNVDLEDLEKIKREIQIICNMNHRNIVRFFNCNYIRNLKIFCLEMELCDTSLRKVIPDLPPEKVEHIFTQICKGVHFLHEEQDPEIMHRDLKPANILLDGTAVKLCDFGEAKVCNKKQMEITNKRFGFGTPEYFAPEIFRILEGKEKNYNKKIDIWALGIILHQMLTKNKHPLIKNCLGIDELEKKLAVLNELAQNPPDIDKSITEIKWRKIIERCLERDPTKRADITELLRMIDTNYESEEEEMRKKRLNLKEIISLEKHSNYIISLRLSDDETKMLTGEGNPEGIGQFFVHLWDFSKMGIIKSFVLTENAFGLCFSKNNPSRIFMGTMCNGISEWDSSSGKLMRNFAGNLNLNEKLYSLDISPNGNTLVSGMSKSVIIWEIASGLKLKILENHSDCVRFVVFNRNGTKIASASDDMKVNIWESSTGEILTTLRGHSKPVFSVSFSADGEKVATGSLDKTAKIWKVDSGKLVKRLDFEGEVLSTLFTPDGKHIFTGDTTYSIKIWEVMSGKLIRTLNGHQNSVRCLAISKDGLRLISSASKILKIWEPVQKL